MKELYYINSRNEVLDFTKPPYLVKDILEIADFSHEYSVTNGKIAFGDDGVSEVPIVLNIYADTPEEYGKAVDRFFEVTEIDSINNVPGRLYYGEQYVLCNLVGSQKKDWCMSVCYMMNYIRLATSKPYWITEKTFSFLKEAESGEDVYLDYPYDYPLDYKGDTKGIRYLHNEHYDAADFRLTVYGPCLSPYIVIDGHPYTVKTNISDGEYLTIDSAAGTITRTMIDGTRINEFNSRGNEYSVFTPIKAGNNLIAWDGNFGFDITLVQKRSEPKWS